MLTGCTFDAAIDTEMFVAFVESFLVPKLKKGQIVIWTICTQVTAPYG